MKILDSIGIVRDVEQNVGQALISAGVASLFTPPVKPVRQPDTKWSVGFKPGLHVREIGPGLAETVFIHCFCRTCANAETWSGPSVFKTAVFRHCGVTESTPEQIVSDYIALRKRREEAWKRKKSAGVPYTPPGFIEHS
jgi:hypothetical protein